MIEGGGGRRIAVLLRYCVIALLREANTAYCLIALLRYCVIEDWEGRRIAVRNIGMMRLGALLGE